MKAVVFIEEQNGEVSQNCLGVLTKASAVFDSVTAVVCGHAVRDLAADLARHGAQRVIVVDHPALADPLPAERADALVQVIGQDRADAILFSASVLAGDVAAGVAARLDAGLCWGMVDLEIRDGRLVGKRLAAMDTVMSEVEWTTEIKVGVFRPGSLQAAARDAVQPAFERFAFEPNAAARYPRLVDATSFADQDGPPLSKADVIVSGGRGIGTAENLGLIRDLASVLGGVAGVSLPLVEMGWAPRSMQVGQTGTVVRPKLYIACGISGQIQHLLGIEQSGTIVAINNDPGAPIMNACDLAVVADFEKIAPPLIELLAKRRSN